MLSLKKLSVKGSTGRFFPVPNYVLSTAAQLHKIMWDLLHLHEAPHAVPFRNSRLVWEPPRHN